MTTFVRKVLPFAIKADLASTTKPDLGVDINGVLLLPTPSAPGTAPAVTRSIPFIGADGTTYYLAVMATAPA